MARSLSEPRLSAHKLASWGAGRVCLAVLVIDVALTILLLLTGREFLPGAAPLELWSDDPSPLHNSQHVMDYFSLSHFVFGMALFGVFAFKLPGWPVRARFILAAASSAVWEAVENTPQVISIFHDVDGYTGDSIVNSLSDTIFSALGFAAAAALPAWLGVAGAVLIEVTTSLLSQNGLILGAVKAFGNGATG